MKKLRIKIATIIIASISTVLLFSGCSSSTQGSISTTQMQSLKDGTYVASVKSDKDLSSYRLEVTIKDGKIKGGNFDLHYAGFQFNDGLVGYIDGELDQYPDQKKEFDSKVDSLKKLEAGAKQYTAKLSGNTDLSKISKISGTDDVYNALKTAWKDIQTDRLEEKGYRNVTFLGDNNNLKHDWNEYIPKVVQDNPSTKVPLVISLHGMGNSIEDAESLGYAYLGATKNFITVCPDTSNTNVPRTWNAGFDPSLKSDEQFILTLINNVEKKYSIDKTRVYITGISNGSGMTNAMALTHPELFAAAAPYAGALFRSYFDEAYPTPDPLSGKILQINSNTVEKRINARIAQGALKLPVCFGINTKDNTYVPLPNGAPVDKNYMSPSFDINRTMAIWEKMNNINTTTWDSKNFFGIQLKDTQNLTKSGYSITMGNLYSNDSSKDNLVKVYVIDNMFHGIFPDYSSFAWDYMSKFSRNVDGTITEKK